MTPDGSSASAVLQLGDRLPEVNRGPITRGMLALYAGASGDHVLLHIDSDYAREAGLDDVFAHGMLSMAFVGQVLTGAFRPDQIRAWSARFLAITPLYAVVRAVGEVVELVDDGRARTARLRLSAYLQDGTKTIEGHALVELD